MSIANSNFEEWSIANKDLDIIISISISTRCRSTAPSSISISSIISAREILAKEKAEVLEPKVQSLGQSP
jgi:hypothetical protein